MNGRDSNHFVFLHKIQIMIRQKQLWTTLIISCVCVTTGMSQSGTSRLAFSLSGCKDSIYLYQFRGIGYDQVDATLPDEQGNGTFELPKSGPAFYYLGESTRSTLPVIAGSEEEVLIQGGCQNIRESEFVVSDLNQGYDNLKQSISELNRKTGQYYTLVQRAQSKEEREQAIQDVQAVDQEKKVLLEVMEDDNPYLARILAINTYLTFLSNQDKYANEFTYFAEEFFTYVDFADPAYAHIPWVYESVNRYAQTLMNISFPDELRVQYFDQLLARTPEQTNTHQMVLGGILSAAETKKSPLFLKYAQAYIDQYGEAFPGQAKELAQKMKVASRLAIGSPAPDFTQATPEGESMALSELRGQYVLIDFWASWCGPCRKENPNVVRLYEKYKEAGFTILGVSLDKNRERWLQAIEKDGLGWHHVSDLKGWSNAVAQDYNIRSIPRTLLLDPEGNIIAKDLRGPSLERKLDELFGDQ